MEGTEGRSGLADESLFGSQGLGATGRQSLRESLDSVLAAQLRLHALLDAVVGIGADLDMRARAEALGGSVRLYANTPRGTVVEWTVPRRCASPAEAPSWCRP